MEENKQKYIKDFKSIQQLLGSYLVADAIIELRGERKTNLEGLGEKNIPELESKNKRANDLYRTFAKMVGFRYQMLWMCKIGLDTIEKYDFKKDPSVMITANTDTGHLQTMFSSEFSVLAKINLEEHTLNVFEKAIEAAAGIGRAMQIGVPVLASLFHDFGKSSQIRSQLGHGLPGKGYKAHADVSNQYIKEMLSVAYNQQLNEDAPETFEMLATIVGNHHPKNKQQQREQTIMFVSDADSKARKEEYKKVKLMG